MRVAVLDDYQGVAATMADWQQLEGKAEVTFLNATLGGPEEVVSALGEYDVLCLMRERTALPARVIEALPRLKLIVTTGMLNASVDVAAARSRGITVCGTGMGGPDTAELAWLLAATLLRGYLQEADEMRSGGWARSVGRRLSGSTIGLLGLGNVGSRVASYARAFDMHVLAWSENLTPERASSHGAEYVDQAALFERSDVVSVHLKLSDRTRGMVGASQLALLGPEGYLVNTSRGPIVVEDDLVRALHGGTIAGAGLDTFNIEPLPTDSPLRTAPRTLLTPHVGYVTRETYRQCYEETLEDVVAWLAGAALREIVDG